MRPGLIHSSLRDLTIYRRLRRQVVTDFQTELAQATGWKKDWVRWKRGIALQERYNRLLFSEKTGHVSLPTRTMTQPQK